MKQGDVELVKVLDLNAVHDLRELLATTLSETGTIVINAENVERIGTPAVQVILAAGKELSNENRSIVISKSSETFQSAFADLGLEDQLLQWSSHQ